MEYLDEVDKYGEPTGKIVERELAHFCGIRHRTSHVWIIRSKNGKIQVLLQKRSSTKDSFPGCYDISSAGHIPAGDSYIDSALRELEEELNVTASPDEFIYCAQISKLIDTEFNGKKFIDNQISNVYFIALDKEQDDFKVDKTEVEAVKWFDLDECIFNVKNDLFLHCIHTQELIMLKDKADKFFKEI